MSEEHTVYASRNSKKCIWTNSMSCVFYRNVVNDAIYMITGSPRGNSSLSLVVRILPLLLSNWFFCISGSLQAETPTRFTSQCWQLESLQWNSCPLCKCVGRAYHSLHSWHYVMLITLIFSVIQILIDSLLYLTYPSKLVHTLCVVAWGCINECPYTRTDQ